MAIIAKRQKNLKKIIDLCVLSNYHM